MGALFQLMSPDLFSHSCPDFHRDKLQQESIFFEGTFAGFPFPRLRAEALWRASTRMTQIEYGLEFHFQKIIFWLLPDSVYNKLGGRRWHIG